MPGYYDRDGLEITAASWRQKQADEDYRVARRFDNDKIRVTLEWNGRVSNPSTFEDYWEMFTLRVWNYNDKGELVPDANKDAVHFGTFAAGLAAYEEFLLRWSESSVDEEGVFVEDGNNLEQVKEYADTINTAIVTDKPATAVALAGDESGGAW